MKPARPGELDAPPSLEAAQVIAPYFVQLVPYAENTGDVSELEALSHPDCVFCKDVLDGVRQNSAINVHVEGGGLGVSEVTGLALDPRSWFTVNFELHEQPAKHVNEFETVVKDFPAGGTYDVEVIVLYEDGRWIVRELSHQRTDS